MKQLKKKQSHDTKQTLWQRLIFGLKTAVLFVLKLALFVGVLSFVVVFAINGYIYYTVKDRILRPEELADKAAEADFDYILVLGAGVRPGGVPSKMLQERIDAGVKAFQSLDSTVLLMSGDSATRYYKETVVMARVAEEQGVAPESIVEDRYGISTYDSIWRLKNIYQGKKVLIITQKYHLLRSLYMAKEFGIDAYGLDAMKVRYTGQVTNEIREVMARAKDFFKCMVKPEALYPNEP